METLVDFCGCWNIEIQRSAFFFCLSLPYTYLIRPVAALLRPLSRLSVRLSLKKKKNSLSIGLEWDGYVLLRTDIVAEWVLLVCLAKKEWLYAHSSV